MEEKNEIDVYVLERARKFDPKLEFQKAYSFLNAASYYGDEARHKKVYENGKLTKEILTYATGGYSDNEELIGEFLKSTWSFLYWQKSERGGLTVWEKEIREK